MCFFLVALIACALLAYHAHEPGRRQRLVSCASFLAGALYCAVSGLFGNPFRLVPAGFLRNFLYLFLAESAIPAAVVCGVFWLWSRDSAGYKVRSLFPLLAGFFCVYLPFRVMFCSAEEGFFGLFVKPVLFLFMLAGFSASATLFYDAACLGRRAGLAVLCAVSALVQLALPAAAESLWYGLAADFAWVSCAAAAVAFPCGLLLVLSRRRPPAEDAASSA